MTPIVLAAKRDDGRFRGQRVAVLCAGSPIQGNGGAERFYAGLKSGFDALGCVVEFVEVPAEESSVARILQNYRVTAAMDLSDYDIVVSSKVPTYAVRHPNHVVFLNHAVRVFDDMFETRYPDAGHAEFEDRAMVHEADFAALCNLRAHISQAHEVARRLMRWRGLPSHVLHPPLGFNAFRPSDKLGEYFVVAGRLHPWKRFDLLIDAVNASRKPLRLLIAGDGEDRARLTAVVGSNDRIEFLGHVPDERLVELYSGAIAVPFLPQREDYGYVTLEAFASGCPVLTCTDSGEPAHIVRNKETGLVVPPTSTDITHALDWFWDNREAAKAMGQRGLALVSAMSWKNTAFELACAATSGLPDAREATLDVAVLDMQPIAPAIGGGRLRLLGLYHGLGTKIRCNYVGTYDWPGESFRSHDLSPTLHETTVPLSPEHHAAAAALAKTNNGKNVIDLAFSRQAHLSPDFLAAVRKATEEAQVVVFSHPWIYPLVRDKLRPNQVVIYDSHNVEGFLRAQLLDSRDQAEREVLEGVIADELECGRRADWILACSQEDLLRFNRLYGFSPAKMRVVPNGAMTSASEVPSVRHKQAARTRVSLASKAFAGIFIGSGYGPNVDAARFINEQLSRACPEVTFVIAGGVGAGVIPTGPNVIVTGQLDDAERDDWLRSADFAVNPMMGGSGTNIKMFDFMAFGLPIVTTAIGARGIESGSGDFMLIAEASAAAFATAISELKREERRSEMGQAARACVEEGYSWERNSDLLGAFMANRAALAGQSRPKFSVVIPSYERPDQLEALMSCLGRQVERDFEVVVVDQSRERWTRSLDAWGFPLFYYHSSVKGAVRARNDGAMLAQGDILAFVDDDCLPEPDWLLNARAYFNDPNAVGLEGLIRSDHEDDPEWRPVSNVGFEGIGFMTANLMVRSAVFQHLGGFDLQFDKPHFREDTDFGWRMQGLGKVPYGRDVVVFHPAQPRSIERESLEARTRFFIKDALLWRKHPERYRELFLNEGHFLNTPGFRETLLQGFASIGVDENDLPAWITERING